MLARTLAPLNSLLAVMGGVGLLVAFLTMKAIPTPFNIGPPEEPPAPVPLEQAVPEVFRNKDAFRATVARARAAVPEPMKREDRSGHPEGRGKALIWDGATDDVSEAHGRLPVDLSAQSPDEAMTVFLIDYQDRRHILNYSYDLMHGGGGAGVKGICIESYISVIAMPGGRPLGRYKVYGNDPPAAAKFTPGQTEVVGAWVGRVAHWAEGSLRGSEWRDKQLMPKVPMEHAGFERLATAARHLQPLCEAKGAAGPIPALPRKILIWYYNRNLLANYVHQAQKYLPAEVQANPGDTEMVVIHEVSKTHSPLDPELAPDKKVHFEHTLSVVVMPEGVPVGLFVAHGPWWQTPYTVDGSDNGPDTPKTVARWAMKLLDDPEGVLSKPVPQGGKLELAPVKPGAKPPVGKTAPERGPVIINLDKPSR